MITREEFREMVAGITGNDLTELDALIDEGRKIQTDLSEHDIELGQYIGALVEGFANIRTYLASRKEPSST